MREIMELSLLGAEILRLRQLKGLGINELGRLAKVSPASISKIEAGIYNSMHPSTIRKLAAVLRVPVKQLMALREQDKPEAAKIIRKKDPVLAAFVTDRSIPRKLIPWLTQCLEIARS